MNDKFKLTEEVKECGNLKLYRIEALKDFNGVKKGDKGGFIEKELNLSSCGSAWVCGDARVYGDAWVYGSAWVYGDAEVYGDAWVYGSAWVCGSARVCGDAEVCGSARVYGDAWVYGSARVRGDAEVCGDAKVIKTPINITGLHYNVTIYSSLIQIGCELHTKEEWGGFTDKRILKMGGKKSLEFWRENKDIILNIG